MNKNIIITIILIILMIGIVTAYNGDLCNETYSPCGGGCTSTDLSYMYQNAVNFDATYGDITGWNTSCITDMSFMFDESTFNQDISGWDVSNVTTMEAMFHHNNVFNQPIGNWNTRSLTTTNTMFVGDSVFDQSLAGWNVSSLTDANYMFGSGFGGTTLSVANYDATLISWASQSVQSNVHFKAGNSQYSSTASSARNDTLIGIYGWTIIDGGEAPAPECVVDSDCGFCMYCNAGTCDYQTHTDTKADCGICQWCDGTGSCANETNIGPTHEDIKNECPAEYICENNALDTYGQQCFNGSCYRWMTGYCLNGGCFSNLVYSVSSGNICINSSAYNSAPTADAYCERQINCTEGQTNASATVYGYNCSGHHGCSGCNYDIPQTSIWNAPTGYRITATENSSSCSIEPIPYNHHGGGGGTSNFPETTTTLTPAPAPTTFSIGGFIQSINLNQLWKQFLAWIKTWWHG